MLNSPSLMMRSAFTYVFFWSHLFLKVKGQLMSKCLFGMYLQFSQKTKEKIQLYNYGTLSVIVSVRFWKNWRYQNDISKVTDL